MGRNAKGRFGAAFKFLMSTIPYCEKNSEKVTVKGLEIGQKLALKRLRTAISTAV
jgi:hypothetical protein